MEDQTNKHSIGIDQSSIYYSEQELLDLVERYGNQLRDPKDEFFDDGNKLLKPFVKQGVISFGSEEDLHLRNSVSCNIPGCKKVFSTVFEYQSHYNTQHRYLCSVCRKALPTSHLLDLHLSERHDSYFAVQAKRQPMYACLVKECDNKFETAADRKKHCIEIHKFPANFRFDQSSACSSSMAVSKNTPSDVGSENQMEVEAGAECGSSKIETSARKVPKTFTFGHQTKKTFNSNMNIKPKKIAAKEKNSKNQTMNTSILEEKNAFNDLMESLPK